MFREYGIAVALNVLSRITARGDSLGERTDMYEKD
jgi:hypothetical protein